MKKDSEDLPNLIERLESIEQELRGNNEHAGIDEILRDLDRDLRRCNRVLFGTDSPAKDDGVVGAIRALQAQVGSLVRGENKGLRISRDNKILAAAIIASLTGLIGSWVPYFLRK